MVYTANQTNPAVDSFNVCFPSDTISHEDGLALVNGEEPAELAQRQKRDKLKLIIAIIAGAIAAAAGS